MRGLNTDSGSCPAWCNLFFLSLCIFYNVTFILFMVDLFAFFLLNLIKLGLIFFKQNILFSEFLIHSLLYVRRFIKISIGEQNQLFFLFVCKKTYVSVMFFTSKLKHSNWNHNWTEKTISTVIFLAENSSREMKILVTTEKLWIQLSVMSAVLRLVCSWKKHSATWDRPSP